MHSMNSQKTGPKVLPIFNMRKRPRQALYAVPSSQESNKKEIEEKNLSQQTFNKIQHASQAFTPTSNKFNNTSSSAQFQGKWEMPNNPYGTPNPKKTFRQPAPTPHPRSNYQAKINEPSQKQYRKIQPAKLLPQHSQNNFSVRNQGPYSQPKPSVQQMSRPAQNSRPFQQQSHPSQRDISFSFSSRPSTSGSYQPNISNFTKVKQDEFKQKPVAPSLRTPEKTVEKKPAPKARPEELMRVLTLSVEGVKKWSQILADDGLLMFEVFGLLNSDVVSHRPNTAKQFMLKDGNHTLQCSFYETDRPMPHVTRGQWIRCVGIFQSSTTTLQCVSIRPVEPAEQRWMKAQMGACEKALKSQLTVVKKEP